MNTWESYKQAILSALTPNFVYGNLSNTKSGTDGWYNCSCPLHDDRHNSFGYNENTLGWICHAGCGKGDVFDYYAITTNMTFKDILLDLGKQLGIKFPALKTEYSPIEHSTIDTYVANLNNNYEIIQYLNNRGINTDTIKKYKIGYDSKKRRITIPIYDEAGSVVNIRLYSPKKTPKMINYTKDNESYGSPARLFGLQELKESKLVILCEGEWDRLLCLQQTGLTTITGTGGAGTWLSEWNEYFRGKDVIIAYDNDDAGRKGTLKIAQALNNIAASVRTIVWPDYMTTPYKDITDFFVGLKKTRKDFKGLIDNAVDIVKPIDPLPFCFWEEEAGNPPHLKINASELLFLLEKDGFKKMKLSPKTLQKILIKIKDNIVEEYDISAIKNYVFTHYLDILPERISPFFTKEDLRKKLIDGINVYIETGKLDALPVVVIDFLRDKKDASYFFYRNGFVEVTRDRLTLKDYKELPQPIWKSQLIDRDISLIDIDKLKTFSFVQFTRNICTDCETFDEKRYTSLLTVLGYLLNNYTDLTYQRAVILSDSTIDATPEGGTGKGILCNAIAKMRNIAQIDGKNIDLDNQFALQSINLDTNVVWFDDISKKFPFERLFSYITEHYSFERKNKDRYNFEPDKNLKTIITTNYSVKGEGTSFERRKFEFELYNYYNAITTPESEFGEIFFASWDNIKWNLFYNFMLRCVQVYLANNSRMLSYSSDTLQKKKLSNEVGHDFIEYADSLPRNQKILILEAYDNFVSEYYSDSQKRKFSKVKFGKHLKAYCVHKGLTLETQLSRDGNMVNRYYFIGEQE
ncbi:MAG: toprim domain-containing protein [Nitrospirae bacterium]|nr:toprim domain-containing protein [Nitrospirota bacterium]